MTDCEETCDSCECGDIPTIGSFKELLNQFLFVWNYPNTSIIKTDEGYVIDKLYITPESVSYKTETWDLDPTVFHEFERFLAFLDSTERHEVSNY